MHYWQPVEILYVLLVAAGITALFAGTLAALLVPLLQKKGILNSPFLAAAQIEDSSRHKRLAALQTVFLLSSLTVLSCILYAYFIEPYHLVIQKLEIRTDKLSASRIRIVQVSDLHCDKTIRLENEIRRRVQESHPDVIVFNGDAVNTPSGLTNFKTLLKSFADSAPTYVAKGDWDFSFNPPLNYFSGTGGKELFATPVKIEKNGESIWLAGVPIGSFSLVKEALHKIPPGAFTVFAYHNPYPDVLPADASVDLFLSGHTHGGQVIIPGIGALVTRSKYGSRYLAGLYQIGKMQMYVNSGVGMDGHFPRLRFLCPPEITVIDIVPAGKH